MNKVEYKLFFAWQEELEAAYLEEQARQGWLFVAIGFCKYTFVKIEPTEYVFQMDYSSGNKGDYHEKKEFLKSCGWDYVDSFLGWQYYRGLKAVVGESGLYSDEESLKEKYSQLNRLFIILGLLNLYFFFFGIISLSRHGTNFVSILNLSVAALLLYGFVQLRLKIKRFNNKIG